MESPQANTDDYLITAEPFYAPQGEEITVFEAAYSNRIPVLLKGPTGCGKTRFMEYMAWRLSRPLITVSCHDDLTASDLVGRYLIVGGETRWIDGPLARAVRDGAICYLDEVVEARKDTTVVIHPLADDRRVLPIEKTGELVRADERDSVSPSLITRVTRASSRISSKAPASALSPSSSPIPGQNSKPISSFARPVSNANIAAMLVKYAGMTRNLKGNGLDEGASTRLLVHTGKLIMQAVSIRVLPVAARSPKH
jgi:nitric oxide reductase NorQ protein